MNIKSFNYPHPYIAQLIKTKLWAQVLLGLFFGLIFGIIIGPDFGIVQQETADIITEWLSIPAHLFLKIIQMIIIPLIFASIIRGITSAGSMKQLQSLGLGVGVYFVITTAIAITIGILVVTIIAPGNFIDGAVLIDSFGIKNPEPIEKTEFTIDDIPQSIVGLVPSNPLTSVISGEMLSIIVFALIVGVSMISLPEKSSRPKLVRIHTKKYFEYFLMGNEYSTI
jgi:Na+/H+-dicarboxylate symporter